jgi:hypothetical protein
MASGITKWGASYLLDAFFGQRNARPASFFVALLTQAPGEQADGTLLSEPPVTSGYARIELPNDQVSWGQAAGGVIATTASVFYATATADWPVITHYALCDAVVEGNVYLFGAFNVPRKVAAGDACRIAPNALNLSIGSLTNALVSAF